MVSSRLSHYRLFNTAPRTIHDIIIHMPDQALFAAARHILESHLRKPEICIIPTVE